MNATLWRQKLKAFLLFNITKSNQPTYSQQAHLMPNQMLAPEDLQRLGMKENKGILSSRAEASLQLAYRGAHCLAFYEGDSCGVGVYVTCNERGIAEGPLMTVYVRMLAHQSPHLYFDNKRNNRRFRRNFPEKINKALLVPCEGYISDRYDLYAPAGYALDALVIGAPDVLDAFDRLNLGGDIEVLGDQLYLLFPSPISLKDRLEEIIKNGAELAREVDDNLSRYQDDRRLSFGQPVGYAGRRLIRK